MPPVTLTAPAQPENPISVSPAVKVQSAPADPWPTADPAAPAATIAPIADQNLQLGAAIKDIPVKVANGTVREVKGLPAGVVFDKQTGVISGKPASDKPAPDGSAGGDGKGKAPGSAAPTGNGNGHASSPALEGTGSNAAIALAAALVLIAAGAVAIKRRRL